MSPTSDIVGVGVLLFCLLLVVAAAWWVLREADSDPSSDDARPPDPDDVPYQPFADEEIDLDAPDAAWRESLRDDD